MDLREFRKIIQKTDTNRLECRNGRHRFPGITDPRTEVTRPKGVYQIIGYCERCGTKVTKLSRSGYLDEGGPSYVHPPDYLIEGAGDIDQRDKNAVVRAELIRRKLERAHLRSA